MSKRTEALNALANIRDYIRNNGVKIPSPVAKDFNIVAGQLGSMHGEYDKWCISDDEPKEA